MSLKTGILLTNLGTPKSPNKADVKAYLSEFLSDKRVVNTPNKFIWWLVLHFIILNTRPAKSAINYSKIWGRFGVGSPLLDITILQLSGVKKVLNKSNDNLEFEIGMRYGKPSIPEALQSLKSYNCNKIIILPLYPQYSHSTTLSTSDSINSEINSWIDAPDINFISDYHQNLYYIESLTNSINDHQNTHGKPETLIMSFHGMPQSYIDKGDVYYEHCLNTSMLLAKSLKLNSDEYLVTFQSVFGKEEWIKPYTDETLKYLASSGVKHVQVVCPGFSADCLETLEEIDIENRENFIKAGGTTFSYINALNFRPDHINALSNIIQSYIVSEDV
jgi:ferrochelatase